MSKKRNVLKLFVVFSLLIVLFSCKQKENNSSPTEPRAIKEVEKVKVVQLNPEEAQKILTTDSIFLVDVRTAEEFNSGFIKNARLLDSQLNFKDSIAELDKEKPVMVYCHSGGRSSKCASILIDAGFKKVYEIEGGISNWKNHDYPVENKL